MKLLCRDFRAVRLARLAGGFSGALVFGVRGLDRMGQATAPSVLKLGPARMIGIERANFERVQPVLGNRAPQLLGCVEAGGRAGLRVAWATMGRERVRTFKALWEADEPVAPVLDEVLGEILGPFYEAAMPGPLAPFAHYGFRQFAHAVRPAVAALGEDADAFVFPGGVTRPNVVRFYERALPSLPDLPGETHLVGVAHGDLNTANILVDGRNNVWVIDYVHTVPGQHVLKDVAKLENDLLFILTKPPDEAALAEAIRLTDALRGGDDLAALPAPEQEPVALPERAPPLRRVLLLVRRVLAAAEALGARDGVHVRGRRRGEPASQPALAGRLGADGRPGAARDDALPWPSRPRARPRRGPARAPRGGDHARDPAARGRRARRAGRGGPRCARDGRGDVLLAVVGARPGGAVAARGLRAGGARAAPLPRRARAHRDDRGVCARAARGRAGRGIRVVRGARRSSRCVENAAQEGFVRGFR